MARARIGIGTLSMVMFLASIAWAQPREPQIIGPASLLLNPDVKRELKLSDEQVDKLKSALGKVMAKYKSDFDKFQKKPPSPEEAEKTSAAFNEDNRKAIERILDAKQSKRFQQILWQIGGISALQDPDLQKELKMSDAQKKKMAHVFEDSGKKIQDLARKGQITKEKVDALMKDAEDKVYGILTDEQKKDLNELKGKPFRLTFRAPPPSEKR